MGSPYTYFNTYLKEGGWGCVKPTLDVTEWSRKFLVMVVCRDYVAGIPLNMMTQRDV